VTKRTKLGPIGPDIDLDQEEVYLPSGERLTEARAEELAEELVTEYRRSAGRPSLTGAARPTPTLSIRVSPRTRSRLESIAKRQNRRLADVTRDALEEYVDHHSHQGAKKRPAPRKSARVTPPQPGTKYRVADRTAKAAKTALKKSGVSR
jgi:hypothetical protein